MKQVQIALKKTDQSWRSDCDLTPQGSATGCVMPTLIGAQLTSNGASSG